MSQFDELMTKIKHAEAEHKAHEKIEREIATQFSRNRMRRKNEINDLYEELKKVCPHDGDAYEHEYFDNDDGENRFYSLHRCSICDDVI